MKPSRITLIGANGRLGRALYAHFRNEHEVIGLTRRHLDLRFPRQQIRSVLDRLDTDVVLLAAGNTDVDGCEREPGLAFQENAVAVDVIAEWCRDRGVRLIHFSTDYVFEGNEEGLRRETDPVRPLSVYGQSKLAGERAALAVSDRNLVVRLSWLFGPGKPGATPDWVVEAATRQDQVSVVADKIGSPGYTPHLAEALAPLLFDQNAYGVLHLANRDSCSWQEWAQYSIDCAVAFGVEVKCRRAGQRDLEEVFAGKAPRPRHTGLSTERYTALTGRPLPHWKEGVRHYLGHFLASRFRGARPASVHPFADDCFPEKFPVVRAA